MKKFKWWWGVGAVIIILLFVSVARSCRIEDKYSKLKGEYDEARRVAEADHAMQLKVIEKAAAEILELDKKLLHSEQAISGLNGDIAVKDKNLAALRESWAGLSAECQGKLRELDTKWAEKFSLLEGVVAEKDKQIADWGRKHAAQVTISESWKVQYESEHRLRLSGETLNKALEGKLRRAKITSSVKTVALVAVAGLLTYKFIVGGK